MGRCRGYIGEMELKTVLILIAMVMGVQTCKKLVLQILMIMEY